MLNLKNKKVIAAVITRDNKILIAQRAKKDALYGKWEFPGGKMELGETEHECLTRELYEEFGIHAEIGPYIHTVTFEYKGELMDMVAFYVYEFTGDILLHEHQQIKWVTKEELYNYDFPDPDKPILERLLESTF